MDERQRMAYMEAMGIQMFVPRWVLPSAAPCRQALLPQSLNAVGATEQVVETRASLGMASNLESSAPKTSPKVVSGIVTDIIGDILGNDTSRTKQERGESRAQNVLDVLALPAAVQSVRFALSLWRVSESLMVIDSHQAKQALPTNALLSNILFAKGLKNSLPSPEVVHWPMIGGGEGGWLQAAEMVEAFLKARFDRQPVQYVWLMGEAAYRSVLPEQDSFSASIGSVRDINAFGCLAVVMPSLTEMLRDPRLKAPVWHAIKAHKLV